MSTKKQAVQVVEVKRFTVSKGATGKGIRYRFTNKKGEVYEYNHDEVVEAAKEKLESLPCWARYKNYTSTNSIPGFAKEFTEKVT